MDGAVQLPVEELSEMQKLALGGDELIDQFFNNLTEEELKLLPYDWPLWARPKQLAPPGDWTYWLLLAGRGFGKTRSIAEWANEKARKMPKSRGAIVAATAADARDVVIEGVSGILACAPPDFKPIYQPSKRRIVWPNGSEATVFSADQPDRLRGPQFHWAVADELAAWRYPAAWDMLQFGLRLGERPQCAIATTPRPLPIIIALTENKNCVVTHGTTYENIDNLSGSFFSDIITKYEGTRLGRQELLAQILSDVPGALWNKTLLDDTRVVSFPALHRIVVAVDPAATSGTTGIVVVGIAEYRGRLHGFVLDDVTTEEGASPKTWAMAAVAAYNKYEADCIVAEINHGGDMVEHVIRTVEGGMDVAYKTVRASRGKYVRAEPISALFEQDRMHMVGFLAKLEDELCNWVPGEESPNRLDAMVWAGHELFNPTDDEPEPHASSEPVVVTAEDMFS